MNFHTTTTITTTSSSKHRRPTTSRNRSPINPPRPTPTSQKTNTIRHLLRRPQPPLRRPLILHNIHQLPRQSPQRIRIRRAGTDIINRDAPRRAVRDSQVAGQVFESGFAGGVESCVAAEDGAGADRGEVDDAAAAADGGEDGLDVEERAEDVGVEHFVEDGGVEGAHCVERSDACVVDLSGEVSRMSRWRRLILSGESPVCRCRGLRRLALFAR